MKFKLSTLLLLILIVAILLGWYVDYSDRSRRDIVGTWSYPTRDLSVMGYGTSLVIRPDGTFTKSQLHRHGSQTFIGKYAVDKEGRIVFRILQKAETTDFDDHFDIKPRTTSLDLEYKCRCAIDKAGFLLMEKVGMLSREENDIGIIWKRSFERSN